MITLKVNETEFRCIIRALEYAATEDAEAAETIALDDKGVARIADQLARQSVAGFKLIENLEDQAYGQ